MHVLVIPSWYRRPGSPLSGIFFTQQAHAMIALGHEVRVLYGRQTSRFKPRNFRFSETIDNKGLVEIFYNTYDWTWLSSHLHDELLMKKAIIALRKYLKKYGRPDVILAHSVKYAGLISDRIKREFDIPFVLYEHSSDVASGRLKDLSPTPYISSDKVLAVSQYLKEKLCTYYPLKEESITVQALGLSPVFRILEDRAEDNALIRIVSVGSLRQVKQYDKAILAIDKLRKKYSIKYTIVGEGEERTLLEKMIHDRSLEDTVRLTGSKRPAEVKNILLKNDILLSTSKVETLGISIMEGLSCGLVVAATNSGGPQDSIDDTNGVWAISDDPKDIAQAIESVILNEGMYDRKKIQERSIESHGFGAVYSTISHLESVI